MAQWLVTGGCGFIGSRLVAALVGAGGHRVRVLDDLSVGRPEKLAPAAWRRADPARLPPAFAADAVELVVGSILEPELVAQAAVGADILVHLAASSGVPRSVEDPLADCRHNVLGTLHCLEAARAAAIRRFVFASSGAPLGDAQPPLSEQTLPRPISPYGASKLAGEAYCAVYYRTYGLDTVTLRFSNVFGPGSEHKSSVVARFIRLGLAGEELEIHGDGRQTRDFIYVDDLVRAILLAAESDAAAGQMVHIAADRETSIVELADALRGAFEAAGRAAPGSSATPSRPGDVRRSRASTERARRLLGWQAETRLEEGLAATLEWFLARSRQEGG